MSYRYHTSEGNSDVACELFCAGRFIWLNLPELQLRRILCFVVMRLWGGFHAQPLSSGELTFWILMI